MDSVQADTTPPFSVSRLNPIPPQANTSASYLFSLLLHTTHNFFFIPLFALIKSCSIVQLSPSPSSISQTLEAVNPSRTPSNFPRNTPPISYVIPVSLRNTIIPSSTAGICCTLSPHSSLHHQATYSPKRIISPPKTSSFRQPIGRKHLSAPPLSAHHDHHAVTPQMPAYTNTLNFQRKRRDGQTDTRAQQQQQLGKTTHSPSSPQLSLQPFFSRRRTDRQDGTEKQRTRMKITPPSEKNQKQKQGHAHSRGRAEAGSPQRVGVMSCGCSGRAYVRHEPV